MGFQAAKPLRQHFKVLIKLPWSGGAIQQRDHHSQPLRLSASRLTDITVGQHESQYQPNCYLFTASNRSISSRRA